MNVLLINPPRDQEIIGNNPAIIEEERGFNPPLGLLYLAAQLLSRTAHRVTVLDAQVERLSYEQLRMRIKAARPDVVGITAMTLTLRDVLRTARLAKQTASKARVVLGGPHVHLFPEETIRLQDIDYLVLGEGEETFIELLERMDDWPALRSVAGVVFEADGEVVHTGDPPLVGDLDALPFPARHLVPYKDYRSLLSRKEVITTLFTSRGCPYRCRFCDRPHLGKWFRARSPGNVVDEIAECVRMGIQEFLVYDDTFTVDRRRAAAICDEIIARRLDVGFDIRARVDTVDAALLRKLKAAGCSGIHYGVEAGSPRVIRALGKGTTLGQVEQAFSETRRQGISILAYFMIGNPGETIEDVKQSFRLARRLRPDYVHMTILTPFPGTQIYRDGLQRGLIPRDVWADFARDPHAAFTPPHWPEHFSREELQDLLVRGYRQFYLRPAYIAQQLLKLRSWPELKKKARAGLRVLGMGLGSDR